jgi:hypothetical protein
MFVFFRMTEFVRYSVDKLLYTSFGQLLVSAIIGLALALMFHRICKDGCVAYFAPHIDEIQDKVFKLEDTCYKYTPHIVTCTQKLNVLDPYDVNTSPINKIEIKTNIHNN